MGCDSSRNNDGGGSGMYINGKNGSDMYIEWVSEKEVIDSDQG